jgi:hypothetical protein
MGSKSKKDLKIKKKKKKEILDYNIYVGNSNTKVNKLIGKKSAKKVKKKLNIFDYVKMEVKQHDTNMLIRHVKSLIDLSESKKREFWIHEDFDEYRK